MRKYQLQVSCLACAASHRCISDHWNDGSDGYAWKSRNLQEKRALALEYLGDVKMRVPIHDAIRMRSDLNRKSLQKAGDDISSFFAAPSDFDFDNSFDDGRSITDRIEAVIDRLLLDEFDGDDIAHVSQSDASLLQDEFFGSDTERAKSMKEWLKLRRETAEYQSYASIPEMERNDWSAWYLRSVRSDPRGNE